MPGGSGRHAKRLHFLLHSGNFDSRHDLSPTETTTLKSNFLDLKAGSATETQFGNQYPSLRTLIQHPTALQLMGNLIGIQVLSDSSEDNAH